MDLSYNRHVDTGEGEIIENIVAGSLEAECELTRRAMGLAKKHLSAEEFFELERDLAAGIVEVRLFADGVVLTR